MSVVLFNHQQSSHHVIIMGSFDNMHLLFEKKIILSNAFSSNLPFPGGLDLIGFWTCKKWYYYLNLYEFNLYLSQTNSMTLHVYLCHLPNSHIWLNKISSSFYLQIKSDANLIKSVIFDAFGTLNIVDVKF